VYDRLESSVEQINNSTEKVQYLHHDQASSTRLITGSTGHIEGFYTYDAYGNKTSSTEALQRRRSAMTSAWASAIAKDFAAEHGRPIPLTHALKFLPLVAATHVDDYDAWASHWLECWLKETPGPKLEHAVDIAAALAELPLAPTDALDALLPACTPAARRTP
jgi:hypothetical protein